MTWSRRCNTRRSAGHNGGEPVAFYDLNGGSTPVGRWFHYALTVDASCNHRLFVDLGLQVTDIDLTLPDTSFVTTLVNWRTGYSFSTNMFIDALVQYRSDVQQFSANLRFNLIHRPLSDFFVVYNEQQYTDDGGVAAGRGVVVKYTHLFSF